jgi:hypothetical protein
MGGTTWHPEFNSIYAILLLFMSGSVYYHVPERIYSGYWPVPVLVRPTVPPPLTIAPRAAQVLPDSLHAQSDAMQRDLSQETLPGLCRVMFNDLRAQLVRFIGASTRDASCFLLVAVAWLTDRTILAALRAAVERGALVLVIVHGGDDYLNRQPAVRRAYERLGQVSLLDPRINALIVPALARSTSNAAPAQENVLVDAVRFAGRGDARMHHKFAVAGHFAGPFSVCYDAVWTGSFNWTVAAQRSLEDAVLIENSETAASYAMQWARIWVHLSS